MNAFPFDFLLKSYSSLKDQNLRCPPQPIMIFFLLLPCSLFPSVTFLLSILIVISRRQSRNLLHFCVPLPSHNSPGCTVNAQQIFSVKLWYRKAALKKFSLYELGRSCLSYLLIPARFSVSAWSSQSEGRVHFCLNLLSLTSTSDVSMVTLECLLF